MEPEAVPEIPLRLLEWLEETFRDNAGSLADSLDTLRYKQGQASVVRKLRAEYEVQQYPNNLE